MERDPRSSATRGCSSQDKRWDQARGVLERLLKSDDKATVAEAARGIGDAYAGEGDQLAAAEYYLTAAYVAPDLDPGPQGAARRGPALRDRSSRTRPPPSPIASSWPRATCPPTSPSPLARVSPPSPGNDRVKIAGP